MAEPSGESCEGCRFWVRTPDGEVHENDFVGRSDKTGEVEIGECRRFPPALDFEKWHHDCAESRKTVLHHLGGIPVVDPAAASNACVNSRWPVTAVYDWCGEFRPRE